MFKKSLLIKLHLYAGLFTVFYLAAFGFSALVLNHKLQVENEEYTKQWQADAVIDFDLTDEKLAESIRDELGLMGWIPYWEFQRDSVSFVFTIVHPGRKYLITALPETGTVKISEAPKGVLAVFHGLHFLNGNIPNAPFLIRTWAVYQWLTLFIMTVSLVLGMWLWIRYNYRPWQGLALAGFTAAVVIIMILV